MCTDFTKTPQYKISSSCTQKTDIVQLGGAFAQLIIMNIPISDCDHLVAAPEDERTL